MNPTSQPNLVLAAMQWKEIEDIDDAAPLNASDAACIEEIKAVLLKHNKIKKFGLTLIHSHFPIGEDEILLEKVSKSKRTLTITPVKLTDVGNAVETQWSLDESAAILACKVKCYIHPPGHDVDHV